MVHSEDAEKQDYSHSGKQSGSSYKTKNALTIWCSNCILGHYHRETKTYVNTKIRTWMFTETVFVTKALLVWIPHTAFTHMCGAQARTAETCRLVGHLALRKLAGTSWHCDDLRVVRLHTMARFSQSKYSKKQEVEVVSFLSPRSETGLVSFLSNSNGQRCHREHPNSKGRTQIWLLMELKKQLYRGRTDIQ